MWMAPAGTQAGTLAGTPPGDRLGDERYPQVGPKPGHRRDISRDTRGDSGAAIGPRRGSKSGRQRDTSGATTGTPVDKRQDRCQDSRSGPEQQDARPVQAPGRIARAARARPTRTCNRTSRFGRGGGMRTGPTPNLRYLRAVKWVARGRSEVRTMESLGSLSQIGVHGILRTSAGRWALKAWSWATSLASGSELRRGRFRGASQPQIGSTISFLWKIGAGRAGSPPTPSLELGCVCWPAPYHIDYGDPPWAVQKLMNRKFVGR